MKKTTKLFIYLILLTSLIFLTLDRHNHYGYLDDYRSELWADKAGYYIYLPALLYIILM